MLRASAVALFTVCLSICLGVAVLGLPQRSQAEPSTAVMVHAGQEIFTGKCLQCHSINQGQVSFGPSLYGEMKKPKPKKSAAEIRAILKNGKGKMPSFQDKLTPEDVNNLMAYLRTL